jgi:hypothetical protein
MLAITMRSSLESPAALAAAFTSSGDAAAT